MKLKVQSNISLQDKHTFGMSSVAKAYVKVETFEKLKAALRLPFKDKMILGGGSNVVFTKDYSGLVIEIDLRGIRVERKFSKRVHLWIGAGENWHKAVLWTLKNKMGGLENLSLIPGKVGASPIQNIGAYGVELKDVFVKLKALEIVTGKVKTFFKKDCQFGYRDSFFKNAGKGKYVILEVCFSLSIKQHKLHTSYGAIQAELGRMKVKRPTIQDVSKAVIKIRQSKLPDPKKIGNSGSFFKNPVISQRKFKTLLKQYPELVNYPMPNGKVKLAAGWLIDQCGWKGKGVGNIKVHTKQALVLTNQGKGSAKHLLSLIQKIISSVEKKYSVRLEPEVNLI
jgi:UDP-N-acetylmuramate dehydrogenase